MTSKIYINEKCRLKVAMNNQRYDNSFVFHRRFVNDWSQDTTFTMVTASESISTNEHQQSDDDYSLSVSITDNNSNNSTSLAIGDIAIGNDASDTNMSMKQAATPSSRRSKRKYEPKEHYTRSKKNRMSTNERETSSSATKASSSSSSSTSSAQTMQTNSSSSTGNSSISTTDTTNPQEPLLPHVVTILQPNVESYVPESGVECQSP